MIFRMCLGELIYNLFFYISTFDKNCTCLEELIKIAYPYKLFLAYFNKLHGEC